MNDYPLYVWAEIFHRRAARRRWWGRRGVVR